MPSNTPFFYYIHVLLSLPTVTRAIPDFGSLSVVNKVVRLTVAMQLYTPDSSLPNELTMAVLVCLVRFIITGPVGESVTPSGPVHIVVTVTGTSTAGSKSTVQVRVTSDPTGHTGLAGSLLTTTVGSDATNRMKLTVATVVDKNSHAQSSCVQLFTFPVTQ